MKKYNITVNGTTYEVVVEEFLYCRIREYPRFHLPAVYTGCTCKINEYRLPHGF